jgi:hypothetical protein
VVTGVFIIIIDSKEKEPEEKSPTGEIGRSVGVAAVGVGANTARVGAEVSTASLKW